MKSEMPILFNQDMMRAWLDGRKTITRRLDGLKEINEQPDNWTPHWQKDDSVVFVGIGGQTVRVPCPYPVGQIRWMRETWATVPRDPIPADRAWWPCRKAWPGVGDRFSTWADYDGQRRFIYRADGEFPGGVEWDWRPSIHMEYRACRTSGRVLDHDHRCQRLQEITEEDAKAEGAIQAFGGWTLEPTYCTTKGRELPTARLAFANCINRLYGGQNWNLKPTNLWCQNPWVWVVKLEGVKP
jgi:hypothetical protein